MTTTLILIAMISLLGMAECQTWTGNYTTNASCDTSVCCCLSGQFVVANYSSISLYMSSSLNGVCTNRTTWSAIVTPASYLATMWVDLNQPLLLNLSSDSQKISVNNVLNSRCSMILLKTTSTTSNAKRQTSSILLALPLMLLGWIINAYKI